MKKLLVLIALIALCISLCACQPNNEGLDHHLDTIQTLQEETLHRVEGIEHQIEP